MRVFRAGWVLPISQPPLRNGWVAVEEGKIMAVGDGPDPPPGDEVQIGGAILPGLVNAHTHLEFSYLHQRIPPTPRFGAWIRAVMAARREHANPADPRVVGPARQAIDAASAAGTCLLGDVSNTLVTVPLLRAAQAAAHVFYELTGFTERQPEARVREARAVADAAAGGDVRISLAPHAPYSVSAALFRAIRADLDAHPGAVSSVHLGETPEELELLRTGSGEIKSVLEDLGRWPADWRPPGTGPVEYLSTLGVLDRRMLVVHGVQFDHHDLLRLRDLGVTVISCPRSNLHVGVGSPPLASFYATGVGVAFGTDSLASVQDLNMFTELKEARRIAPRVPARLLLQSATLVGAEALRFDDQYGSLDPGKRAAIIAVAVPGEIDDVEEYLVGGIEPRDVRWISETLNGER